MNEENIDNVLEESSTNGGRQGTADDYTVFVGNKPFNRE